jgi:antitoxin HicB
MSQNATKKRDMSGWTSLDDLLDEDGIRAEVNAAAIKRVVALQLEDAMAAAKLSKSAMASAMGTSRRQLDRVLDPDDHNITLQTLARAARAIGKDISINLVD